LTFAISLDPDEALQNMGPHLRSKLLDTQIIHKKNIGLDWIALKQQVFKLLKENKKEKNYLACKKLMYGCCISAIDEGIEVEGSGSNASGTDESSSGLDEALVNDRNAQASDVKGPFVYELFSIMIHSGSAAGGHYYAYIK